MTGGAASPNTVDRGLRYDPSGGRPFFYSFNYVNLFIGPSQRGFVWPDADARLGAVQAHLRSGPAWPDDSSPWARRRGSRMTRSGEGEMACRNLSGGLSRVVQKRKLAYVQEGELAYSAKSCDTI